MTLLIQIYEFGKDILFRLVPSREQQIPFEWKYAPDAFMCIPSLFLMGYLSRRRNTHLLRQLLWPLVVLSALRGFRYHGTDPDLLPVSWVRGMMCIHAMVVSLDLALPAHGKMKVHEKYLPPMGGGASFHANGDATSKSNYKVTTRHPLFRGLLDAIEVISETRWIGWKGGEGTSLPKTGQTLSKADFIKSRLFILLRNFLLMDLYDNLLRAFPDISNPFGGSMFYSHLPPLQRYAVSTVIQMIFGSFCMLTITSTPLWMSVIGVGVLGQSPAAWPSLMDNPWASTSLHELWSKRWHQMMRRNFMVAGGNPGQWVAGRAGLVLGTFIASGLYHDLAAYTLPGPMDFRPTLFFALQGVGVLLEDLYREITGRRVEGLAGRVWTYLFVIGFGQVCVDAWLMHGIAGNPGMFPSHISPSARFIKPIADVVVERMLQPWY